MSERKLQSDRDYKANLEENFLKHIGYEHVENLCDELDADSEHWNDIKVPESLDQWFRGFHKKEEKKKKRGSQKTVVIKIMKRVAVVLVFLIGANYFLMANVSAYRLHILNTIISIQEKFTQFDYNEEETKANSSSNIPKDWNGWYYPKYLPQGYDLYMSKINNNNVIISYKDPDGNHILFTQTASQSSHQLDTEDGRGDKLLINKEEAFLTEKNGLKLIIWKIDDNAFSLEANKIDVNEMIKIAENIEIKK